jgi:hypothetical protein
MKFNEAFDALFSGKRIRKGGVNWYLVRQNDVNAELVIVDLENLILKRWTSTCEDFVSDLWEVMP